MKTIGIVAEYNPFHLGHALQIRESRRIVEAEGEETAVVAVMSGDFVQRGEAAVFSKYARAEAACRSGADLVVELPLPWVLSSAEGFAEGAVSILADLGAEVLSFGCETGDSRSGSGEPGEKEAEAESGPPAAQTRLRELEEAAELIAAPGFTDEVLKRLKAEPGQSFAAARQACAEEILGKKLPVLQQPNSILALEYLKAIRVFQLPLTPLVIPRRGAGHDERGANPIPSASELRDRLRGGRGIEGFVPEAAEEIFRRERLQGRCAADPSEQGRLLLSRLRWLGEEEFRNLPDAGDGLGNRLYGAVKAETSYEEVLKAASTRRYPLARIRRLCFCAALGVPAGFGIGRPPYARILALNERGRRILRDVEEKRERSGNGIPILNKPAHVRELGGRAEAIFRLGAQAHDFYTLLFPEETERRCGEDWRRGPTVCS